MRKDYPSIIFIDEISINIHKRESRWNRPIKFIKQLRLTTSFVTVELIYRWTCRKIRPIGTNRNLGICMHTGHVTYLLLHSKLFDSGEPSNH